MKGHVIRVSGVTAKIMFRVQMFSVMATGLQMYPSTTVTSSFLMHVRVQLLPCRRWNTL